MYKYITDVSTISHNIINNFCKEHNIAVDATLGNGHDTDFLKNTFSKVYSFDIQKDAVDNYASKISNEEHVILINDSHDKFKSYIKEEVNCFIFNLGFLPGGNKSITTMAETTILSINNALELLSSGGIIAISIYWGHDEGKREKEKVLRLLSNLPKNKYAVLLHSFINRDNNPPLLAIIEKK